jgi:DNA-binding NtrC family response regulator
MIFRLLNRWPLISNSGIFSQHIKTDAQKQGMTKTTLHPAKAKKVLIIEDEGDMCLLLNIILTGKELELEHVKNLSEAEAYLQQEQPAVVILDNKLPDGFGVDFILYIKKNYPNIRIIMISGFDGSVKDVALENGADIFLQKPFTKDQLYQSIKGLTN